MIKTYEFVVLFSPELADRDVQIAQDSLVALVKKYKGKVVSTEVWGKKPLAYKIKKFTEGSYVFFVLEMDTAQVQGFDREVRLNTQVLRHLIVIQEEHLKKGTRKSEDATSAGVEG